MRRIANRHGLRVHAPATPDSERASHCARRLRHLETRHGAIRALMRAFELRTEQWYLWVFITQAHTCVRHDRCQRVCRNRLLATRLLLPGQRRQRLPSPNNLQGLLLRDGTTLLESSELQGRVQRAPPQQYRFQRGRAVVSGLSQRTPKTAACLRCSVLS